MPAPPPEPRPVVGVKPSSASRGRRALRARMTRQTMRYMGAKGGDGVVFVIGAAMSRLEKGQERVQTGLGWMTSGAWWWWWW